MTAAPSSSSSTPATRTSPCDILAEVPFALAELDLDGPVGDEPDGEERQP